MASAPPYAIHWFRRDLRIAGNTALGAAHRAAEGRVLGAFWLDPGIRERPDFSPARFAWFLSQLRSLREELRAAGSDLVVHVGAPERELPRWLAALRAGGREPRWLTFNRDYEPYARRRDLAVRESLEADFPGVEAGEHRDHLLFEPDELLKEDGGFYQVFTPYWRRWLERLRSGEGRARVEALRPALRHLAALDRGESPEPTFRLRASDLPPSALPEGDALESAWAEARRTLTIELPPAGSLAAYRRARAFAAGLPAYAEARDFPGRPGTSRASLDLKCGAISVPLLIALHELDAGTFLKELAWREFYYSILWHAPRVENEAFLAKYRDLPWENREDLFAAWVDGRTGYPIVDAGMRQLRETGWMHNRARMITASFLTKDLLVDWRQGERHFMRALLDGDLAPNNGGWQWAASTGCDPQPYFRVFNPRLQGERFDPPGEYVRRWVPELAGLDARAIHAPHALAGAAARRAGYPEPIVDHAARKERAIALFRAGRLGP